MKKSAVTGEPIPDDSARIPVYTYKNPRPAEWPQADFIIGNPPYLGKLKILAALGEGYVGSLRQAFEGSVGDSADYVMYWWYRASTLVLKSRTRRAGLVTTNSIRQPFNKRVVQGFLESGGRISLAVPDHPWTDDGAAIRVSMSVLTMEQSATSTIILESSGEVPVETKVARIGADLAAETEALRSAALRANEGLSHVGVGLHGQGFALSGDQAQALRDAAARDNVEDLGRYFRPTLSGRDLVQESRSVTYLDLYGLDELAVRKLGPIYQWVLERVKPERDQNPRESRRARWWLFGENAPNLREATAGLGRVIATSLSARHRVFVFMATAVLPDQTIVAIACEAAEILGMLSSRVHLVWARKKGAFLGVGNDLRYLKATCFDEFPFPVCVFAVAEKVRQLGEQLDAHRKRQQAAHPGLTITGMYNVLEKLRSGEELSAKERGIHEQALVSVLKQIHDELDAAVFSAYGWPVTLTDEEILERLVALNHERAEEEKRGIVRWLRPEFQNPQGKKDAVQDEIPGTSHKKSKKGAKATAAESPAKTEKRVWPKELPQQVAAVRDLLGEAGALDLAGAKAAFKGVKDEALTASLDSLAALGLAVASGAGPARSWSAVR